MTMRLDEQPAYKPARSSMTRLGVSTDELNSLIDKYLVQAAHSKVLGDDAGELKNTGTVAFLQSELKLHNEQNARGSWRWGVRQLLRWIGGGVVAVAIPVLVVCLLLGMFDLGSALSR